MEQNTCTKINKKTCRSTQCACWVALSSWCFPPLRFRSGIGSFFTTEVASATAILVSIKHAVRQGLLGNIENAAAAAAAAANGSRARVARDGMGTFESTVSLSLSNDLGHVIKNVL